MSLVFQLQQKSGGFFYHILKMASNYLYAKRNNLSFFVEDSTWLFQHSRGWRDYFTSLQVIREKIPPLPIHPELHVDDERLHHFTLQEYTDILEEIFQLQEGVQDRYEEERKKLPKEYNSIVIRRGDKMYGEAFYISTKEYVNKLLEKSELPIFVQTDDYTAYEEVCQYIQSLNKNIPVVTTCPEDKRGAFVFNYEPSIGSVVSEQNNTYLKKLATRHQKSVNQYSPTEMKEHVQEVLVGFKLCMESCYAVTDFQSNCTRFLVCSHNNPSNVLSVGPIAYPPYDVPLQSIAKGWISS